MEKNYIDQNLNDYVNVLEFVMIEGELTKMRNESVIQERESNTSYYVHEYQVLFFEVKLIVVEHIFDN